MSKLEQKLIELGYELNSIEYYKNKPAYKNYIKHFQYCHIRICLGLLNYKYLSLSVRYDTEGFAYQEVIDNLQQVFNIRNKDLEILKELELCQD